jgi:hypothetical protein
VKKEYARPLAVWAAYVPALAALYRGTPPPARAKVLAERGASAVFAQPPNASLLVARSWCALLRAPLPTILANENAIELSGLGPLPTFPADETAIESSGSGPLPAFLANETAIESSGSGPQPTLGPRSLCVTGLGVPRRPVSSFLRAAT